jgi:hypothetical protein
MNWVVTWGGGTTRVTIWSVSNFCVFCPSGIFAYAVHSTPGVSTQASKGYSTCYPLSQLEYADFSHFWRFEWANIDNFLVYSESSRVDDSEYTSAFLNFAPEVVEMPPSHPQMSDWWVTWMSEFDDDFGIF